MTLTTETRTLSSLELFYEEILRDSSLQEQLKTATSPESLIEIAMKLGAERGYNFDEIEVRKCLEKSEDVHLTQQPVEMAICYSCWASCRCR